MPKIPTEYRSKQLRPQLGVSRCLLGDPVRYDGQSKPCDMILGTLSKLFDLVPVCPEVEAGLGIPRPPVQLTGDLQNPSMIGRDNPALDVTDLMREYTASKLNQLTNLDGFIFKCRSPSCGLNSTPIYIDGKCRTESARGLFAHEFCRSFPQLPVIEDTSLENAWLCEEFITRVNEHWRHKITY